jgi:hypothetical protein
MTGTCNIDNAYYEKYYNDLRLLVKYPIPIKHFRLSVVDGLVKITEIKDAAIPKVCELAIREEVDECM